MLCLSNIQNIFLRLSYLTLQCFILNLVNTNGLDYGSIAVTSLAITSNLEIGSVMWEINERNNQQKALFLSVLSLELNDNLR